MRKAVVAMLVLTVLTIALFPVGVCAGKTNVSETDALEIAQNAFMELCALQPDAAQKYRTRASYNDLPDEVGGDIWVVVFEYETPYDLGFRYFGVDVNANDGIVGNTSDPIAFMAFMEQFMKWEEQAELQEALERDKGPYRDLAGDEKASFPIDSTLADFARAQDLPLPEDMQLWEAVDLARVALNDEYGLTEQDFEGLTVSGTFYQQESPKAWIIGFRSGSDAKYAVTVSSPDGTIAMVDKY